MFASFLTVTIVKSILSSKSGVAGGVRKCPPVPRSGIFHDQVTGAQVTLEAAH